MCFWGGAKKSWEIQVVQQTWQWWLPYPPPKPQVIVELREDHIQDELTSDAFITGQNGSGEISWWDKILEAENKVAAKGCHPLASKGVMGKRLQNTPVNSNTNYDEL